MSGHTPHVPSWTQQMWEEQDRHVGDRLGLFTVVGEALPTAQRVLYPGSFVDLAPSFVFDDVTYVDVDRRAERFFGDTEGVDSIIGLHRGDAATWRFVAGDYSGPLDVPEGEADLLISLYAGFVSEHCTGYLRRGGHLLVNPSHGDAAMASIDPRYELVGVVTSGSGTYRVIEDGLDRYLVPKRPLEITREYLHEWGRGVAYTRSAFAYLFRKR